LNDRTLIVNRNSQDIDISSTRPEGKVTALSSSTATRIRQQFCTYNELRCSIMNSVFTQAVYIATAGHCVTLRKKIWHFTAK